MYICFMLKEIGTCTCILRHAFLFVELNFYIKLVKTDHYVFILASTVKAPDIAHLSL